jgi:succinoglycan biosynthesis transport protein ExoP
LRSDMTSIAALEPRAADSQALPGGPAALFEYGFVSQPDWLKIRRSKARLESQLDELRTRFRDAHPAIQQVIRDLASADRELNVEMQYGLRQFHIMLSSLTIREQAARRVELEWQDEALEINRKSHDYATLQRTAGRLQSLYDLIFNRLKEIDISVGIEPESIRIIERAEPSGSPVTPRKVQSIFMAAIIGLGIGLGLVLGLEYIDDSLRYPEEVKNTMGVPFLGVIPKANWDPDDLKTHLLSNFDQKSGLAEAYRNMRSAILFNAGPRDLRHIVVTSAVPLEGKTTTSLNLAVSLAQTGSRVLLVDGDLRRGELHKFFGLEGGRGFSDVLMGQAKPDAVVQRTAIPNLDLIATGPFPPNPAELMFRPELNAFLEYASRTYDRILFDCAPVMAVSEAPILCSLAQGVVFVVWAGHTSRKLCQSAIQVLRERGAHILGCVLNSLEFNRVGYYYYSTYYSYYDYNYRYERSPSRSR